MATLGKGYITFRDINAGTLPDGSIDKEVVELCAKENPVLEDVLWKECRSGREDITTIRTGIPEATFRAYYEGVQGSKGGKRQVTNACGTISTALEFDARLYDDAPDKAQFLYDEVEQHAASMGDGAASALFYGNVSDNPKGFNGLAKTFSETAGATVDDTEAAFYALNGLRAANSATTMLRSLWLVGWGKKSVHGIYPQGSSVGLQRGKLEFIWVPDPEDANKKLRVGIQEMNWNLGLNIRDFRYCGRIANIEAQAAFSDGTGFPNYVELVQRLACRVRTDGVTTRFYMPKIVWEIISTDFFRKTMGNAVKYADLGQKLPAALMGIPVALCDALNVNETAVAAKA